MIDIEIPGFGRLQLSHFVSDYNGTLAPDGLDLLLNPNRLIATLRV